MEMEDINAIQLSDGDENDVRMDDVGSDGSVDLDQISNWTSLEVQDAPRKPNSEISNSSESKASSIVMDYGISDNLFSKDASNSKVSSINAHLSFILSTK